MKASKRNTRDQKYCDGSEKCFDRLISRLDIMEESISELEDESIKYSKTKKQREQWLKNTHTHYPRTVRKL